MSRLSSLRNRKPNKSIRSGDSVRDINPNWPNYMETGTVLKVEGNRILWKSNKGGYLLDEISKMEKI